MTETTVGNAPCADPIVERVVADLRSRSRVGLNKYGVSLDRPDVDLLGWLKHSYEECLDMANYLRCAIEALEKAQK